VLVFIILVAAGYAVMWLLLFLLNRTQKLDHDHIYYMLGKGHDFEEKINTLEDTQKVLKIEVEDLRVEVYAMIRAVESLDVDVSVLKARQDTNTNKIK